MAITAGRSTLGHEQAVFEALRDTLKESDIVVARTSCEEKFEVAMHFLRVTGRLVVELVQESLNACFPAGMFSLYPDVLKFLCVLPSVLSTIISKHTIGLVFTKPSHLRPREYYLINY